MRIHFFGKLADSFGPAIDFPVSNECSITELREKLAEEYPDAASALGIRVRACVGENFVPDSHIIQPGDLVEFIPPVSGG